MRNCHTAVTVVGLHGLNPAARTRGPQVVGLTVLLYVGSPQSKESEDRSEEKLDAILRKVDPEGAERLLADIDRRHPQS